MTALKSCFFGCPLSLALLAGAHAADLRWTTVMSEHNAAVAIPELPAAVYNIGSAGPKLAHAGNGELGFSLTTSGAGPGHWAETSATANTPGPLKLFAAINVANSFGPGRSGSEANHVFFALPVASDASGFGTRAFVGRAGDPNQPVSVATYGIWYFNGVLNTEIARVGASTNLGPGIAAGWRYDGTFSENFARPNASTDGRIALITTVNPPASGAQRTAVVLHTPGVGSQACALEGVSDAALAPSSGGTFAIIFSIGVDNGPIFMRSTTTVAFNAVGSEGIWRVCEGAPQAKALTYATDARGPGLAASGAFFELFDNVINPAEPGAFFFIARGKESLGSGAVPFRGVFHHNGQTNAPIILRSVQGPLGPRVPGYVIGEIAELKHQVSGRFGVLNSTITNVVNGNDTREALWRTTRAAGAVPVAVQGDLAEFLPAAGRRWANFYNEAVFENGDIVTLAETRNNAGSESRIGLWRLRAGRAPESIVSVGDRVTALTTSGPQLVAITALITPLSGSGLFSRFSGDDAWASANGSAMIAVRLAGFGITDFYIRGQVTNPQVAFADGFE